RHDPVPGPVERGDRLGPDERGFIRRVEREVGHVWLFALADAAIAPGPGDDAIQDAERRGGEWGHEAARVAGQEADVHAGFDRGQDVIELLAAPVLVVPD